MNRYYTGFIPFSKTHSRLYIPHAKQGGFLGQLLGPGFNMIKSLFGMGTEGIEQGETFGRPIGRSGGRVAPNYRKVQHEGSYEYMPN